MIDDEEFDARLKAAREWVAEAAATAGVAVKHNLIRWPGQLTVFAAVITAPNWHPLKSARMSFLEEEIRENGDVVVAELVRERWITMMYELWEFCLKGDIEESA